MSDAQKPTQGGNRNDLTFLLDRAAKGDSHATNELFPRVYAELRTMAESQLGQERAGHTLQPTALVNEAYLRLIGPDGKDTPWENRGHFFGAAAQAIRRILTDHARAKNAAKRGGNAERESDSLTRLSLPESQESPVDFEALDAALTKLAALDPFKASIVELRYFAGLTGDETALALNTSASTIAREWAFIRVWLHRELSGKKADLISHAKGALSIPVPCPGIPRRDPDRLRATGWPRDPGHIFLTARCHRTHLGP